MLIGLAVFDMLWTVVITACGPGPFTNAAARGGYRLATRRAIGRHRRLELLGYGILLGTVLTWVLAIWFVFGRRTQLRFYRECGRRLHRLVEQALRGHRPASAA